MLVWTAKGTGLERGRTVLTYPLTGDTWRRGVAPVRARASSEDRVSSAVRVATRRAVTAADLYFVRFGFFAARGRQVLESAT
jgi:hypothetical protein